MELFDLEKDKIVPKAHTLLIQDFKVLWDRDKSKDKKLALLELAFVFYSSDYKSVYLSSPPEEREEIIIEDLFGKEEWTPDTAVLSACTKYKKLQEVPTMRLLDAQESALEELVKFFKTLNMQERDRSGKPIHKPKDISSAMADAAKVADALNQLRDKVKRELDLKGRIRGGGEAGEYEN